MYLVTYTKGIFILLGAYLKLSYQPIRASDTNKYDVRINIGSLIKFKFMLVVKRWCIYIKYKVLTAAFNFTCFICFAPVPCLYTCISYLNFI